MELSRWIDHTLSIQSIPAPTFDEAERATYLRSEFEKLGVDSIDQDDIGNLYVKLSGIGNMPPTIITAHLDTVFSQATDLSHQRTRSRIVGPGVGDNSVALAALLELAHDLQDLELPGDVWLVANVGEEGLGNLRGMREVVARFEGNVSAYLVLEGMALGHVYHRALPVHRYRLVCKTDGGHSWIHAGRTSAVHKLIEVASKLLELPIPSEPRTTLNIGRIEGGRTINSIADRAVCEIDLRSESETTLGELEAQIHRLLEDVDSEDAEIEITLVGSRPGGELPAGHPLVVAALETLSQAGERDAYLEYGSTDASVPLSRGYPAVCVGLTKGGEAHSNREYIEVKPMRKGFAAIFNLIEASFSLERN